MICVLLILLANSGCCDNIVMKQAPSASNIIIPVIKNINKNKNEYDVEIVEYLEDYSNSAGVEDEDEVYDIYIKNLNQDTIATIKSNEGETKAIETVKENIDKFTSKTRNLMKVSDGNIYVKQVEQGGQK